MLAFRAGFYERNARWSSVVKRLRFFLCSGLMWLDVFLDRLSNELGAGYDPALLYEVIDLVQ
jgi:hypothetical protein